MTCRNMSTPRQIVTRLFTYGGALSGSAFVVLLTVAVIVLAGITGFAFHWLIGPWGAPLHAALFLWLGYSVAPRLIEQQVEREQRGRESE